MQIPLFRLLIVGTLLCTIDAVAIVGSITVLAAIYRKKYLQTATNFFIASLACADLGVAILVLPISIYVELFPQQRIVVDSICHLWLATDIMFCTSSVLNLCAICWRSILGHQFSSQLSCQNDKEGCCFHHCDSLDVDWTDFIPVYFLLAAKRQK